MFYIKQVVVVGYNLQYDITLDRIFEKYCTSIILRPYNVTYI